MVETKIKIERINAMDTKNVKDHGCHHSLKFSWCTGTVDMYECTICGDIIIKNCNYDNTGSQEYDICDSCDPVDFPLCDRCLGV